MGSLWIITSILLALQFITVLCDGDIGPGKWRVTNFQKRNQPQHRFKIEVEKRKINRTHDGFNAILNLKVDFTTNFSVRIDVCKYVDGGCKLYQVLTDESLPRFIDKYAKSNRQTAFEIAGVDPPDFPLAKGYYEIKNFIFDYDELPSDGIYGKYCAVISILLGNEEIGCAEVQLEFKEDDNEDCDEYDEK